MHRILFLFSSHSWPPQEALDRDFIFLYLCNIPLEKSRLFPLEEKKRQGTGYLGVFAILSFHFLPYGLTHRIKGGLMSVFAAVKEKNREWHYHFFSVELLPFETFYSSKCLGTLRHYVLLFPRGETWRSRSA